MSDFKKLQKGVAYHGNRFLGHIRDDMKDIVNHGFDTVVHMFSHNDWDRHKKIMKEIFDITKSYGLDVWVDNWGITGGPGDKAHFLSYHSEAHQINSDGTISPTSPCLNSPEFVQFTKDWVDVVGEAGGDKIFWDEPSLHEEQRTDGLPGKWTCRCQRCQKLFEERYNKPMPTELTDEVMEFRMWSIVNYFDIVSKYAKAAGMYNSICVMLDGHGINLDNISSICDADALDNIGSDPYWGYEGISGHRDVYHFVYEKTKMNLDVCNKFNKDHNLWIQGHLLDKGSEEEIITAADAMYDAGARNIFVWGYRGCEGNDYRAEFPDMLWNTVGQAMQRISERWRNDSRELIRKEMGLK